MKKLLKKKVKIFGKEISVFLIAIIAVMALAAAALVPYLSNKITGTFNVASPLVMTINGSSSTIYGGESVKYVITVENKANVSIIGKTSINVTNSDGVTCNDFQSIMVGMTTPWFIAPVNILTGGSTNCWVIDSNTIGLMFGPVNDTYTPGRLDTINVTATLKQNAFGTYTFNAQILEPNYP